MRTTDGLSLPDHGQWHADQWRVHSLSAERGRAVLVTILTTILMPLWILFDWALEPAMLRPFAVLRLADTAAGLLILIALLRVQGLTTLRMLAALKVLSTGAAIAVMMPYIGQHYFPYVFGFSLIFWGSGVILSWPLPYPIATYGTVLAIYVGGTLAADSARPAVEFVGALFYLLSAVIIVCGLDYVLLRLRRQAFMSAIRLESSNRDLARALATLKDTQTRLVEAEKRSALGRLLAQLSHEINNPVNVIYNNLPPLREYLQTLTAMADECERVARHEPRCAAEVGQLAERLELDFVKTDAPAALAVVEEATNRIRRIHADLRSFIRGDALQPVPSDLNEALRATMQMLERSLPPAVALRASYGPLPVFPFQPGQINQLIFNLLQNAIDAQSDRGGEILASTSLADGQAVLTVADTGPGVPPDVRPRLFEPFFTTKGAGKGTGLGLAICSQIAASHGGSLELDEAYTQGASFVLRLPLAGQPAGGLVGPALPDQPAAVAAPA